MIHSQTINDTWSLSSLWLEEVGIREAGNFTVCVYNYVLEGGLWSVKPLLMLSKIYD